MRPNRGTARTGKTHFRHFRCKAFCRNERFDSNVACTASSVMDLTSRGSRHRRIHFVEFSPYSFLSVSLSPSSHLSFPLTLSLHTVNIYVLILLGEEHTRALERFDSPQVGTYVCNVYMYMRKYIYAKSVYRENHALKRSRVDPNRT